MPRVSPNNSSSNAEKKPDPSAIIEQLGGFNAENDAKYLRTVILTMADEAAIRGRDAILDPNSLYPFLHRMPFSENTTSRWRIHNLVAKRLVVRLTRNRLNTIARFWKGVKRHGLRSSDLARTCLGEHGIDIECLGGISLEAIRTQWFEDPEAMEAVDRMIRRIIAMVGASADRPVWPPFDKLNVAMAPQTILMAYVYGFRPTAVFDMLGHDEIAIVQAASRFAANMDRCVKTLLEFGTFSAVSRSVVQNFMRDLYAYMLRLQIWEKKLQSKSYPTGPLSPLLLDEPALLQPTRMKMMDSGELIRVDRLVYALLSPSRFDGLTFADVFPGAFYRSVTRPRLEGALGITAHPNELSPGDKEDRRLAAFKAAAQFVLGNRARSEAFLRHVCHFQIVRGNAGCIRGTMEWARFILMHLRPDQTVTVPTLLMGGLISLVVKRSGDLERIEILQWSARRIRRLQRLVDAVVDHRVGARMAALEVPAQRFFGTEYHRQAMYAARATITEQIALAADEIRAGTLVTEEAASRYAFLAIAWDLSEIAKLSDAIYAPIIRHAMEVYRLEASMMPPPPQ